MPAAQRPDPYWTSDDGTVTLYCGDCLDILPTFEDGEFDAVVTDPPYGIGDAPNPRQGRTGKRCGKANTWHPESTWDVDIDPRWCGLCCVVSDVVAWFGHWRKRSQVEMATTHPLRSEIVWVKDTHVGPPSPLAMQDERIWLFARRGICGTRFETSVWNEAIIPTWAHRNHKNEKPTRLMTRLITWLGASTIIDPFMGSGTTGVACVRTGRNFVGIEIDEGYCEIARKRIQQAFDDQGLFRQAEREQQMDLVEDQR